MSKKRTPKAHVRQLAAEIAAAYQAGRSTVMLAEEYNLCDRTVANVVRRAGMQVRSRTEATGISKRRRLDAARRAVEDAGGKICTGCKTFRPLTEFRPRRKTWHARCNPCRLSAQCAYTRCRRAKTGGLPDREYQKRRQQTPLGKIRNRIVSAINAQLRQGKNRRPTFAVLGYSADDLRRHLEKQFTRGMTWEKFSAGEIHIDHRIPASKFDIREFGDAEFLACWALTNLQPMWALDNLKKGSRREVLL